MPARRRDKDGLIDTERAFVLEYMENGRVGADAYQLVHPECSRAAAAVIAFKLLKKPQVQRYLQKLTAEQFKELGISTRKTMEKIATLAYINLKPESEKSKDRQKVKDLGLLATQNLRELAKIQKMLDDDAPIDPEGEAFEGPRLILPVKGSYELTIKKEKCKT
jgi:hypothetical protein